jgi:hypothetical protein
MGEGEQERHRCLYRWCIKDSDLTYNLIETGFTYGIGFENFLPFILATLRYIRNNFFESGRRLASSEIQGS